MAAVFSVLLSLLLLSVCYFSVISATGPRYDLVCSTDADCRGPAMKCYYDYEGCDVGVCGCVYGVRDSGSCLLKTVGDECTSHSQCPLDLDCHNNRCTCTGEMIDSMYCKKPYEVLLGRECAEGQICLHKTEDGTRYVSSDVICNHGYCTCRKGLKHDGNTCRRIRPDEKGCLTSVDCSGDSVCKNNQCRCPEGYRIVTYEPRKCGRWNAVTDLAEGQVCDEFLGKDRFCARNLQCVACGDEPVFRCRKYKSTRPEMLSASARPLLDRVLLWLILTWCFTWFLFTFL